METTQQNVSKDTYKDIIKILINSGANINDKDIDGNTVLILCSDIGDIEMVKFLINHGADTNIKNNKGETAFSIATEKNYDDIALLLSSKNSASY